MSNLTDPAWIGEAETGGTVKKTFTYSVVVGGEQVNKDIDVDIRVLSGLDYASYQDSMVTRDELTGEVTIDSESGISNLISLSTGLSHADVEQIRKNKPMSLWQGLITVCQAVNASSTKEVEDAKNGDGQD